MPRGSGGWGEGSTLGVGGDPKVIPRRFKRKKNFVTDARTHGRTDRRDGGNSDLDELVP